MLSNFNIEAFCNKRRSTKPVYDLPYACGVQATYALLKTANGDTGRVSLHDDTHTGRIDYTMQQIQSEMRSLIPLTVSSEEFCREFPAKIKAGLEAADQLQLANAFPTNRAAQETLNSAKNTATAFLKSMSRDLCQHVTGLDRALKDAGISIEKGK